MRSALRRDEGSAPAEFVMVTGLLLTLVLGTLQLAIALHVRNTVLDAAAEGARYGALADRSPHDAARRTAELITAAVGEAYAREITVEQLGGDGQEVIVVTVRAALPLIGTFGPERIMEARGRALVETVD